MSLNMRFDRKPLRRLAAILSLAALLAVAAVGTFGSSTSANVLGSMAAAPLSGAQGQAATLNDGFDQLTTGQQGPSYSTLTHMGRVHPPSAGPSEPDPSWHNPFVPFLNITWGAAQNASTVSAGEPAVGINPSNPLYALVSGNVP